MSRILLVQPHRILQQAIALALFPEHEVVARAEIPARSEAEKFDIVIVDTSAAAAAGAEHVQGLASWDVPLILIGPNQMFDSGDRQDIVSVEKPLARQSLESAVARCIAARSSQNGVQRQKRNQGEDSEKALGAEDKVIDLTEIVEEENAPTTPDDRAELKK